MKPWFRHYIGHCHEFRFGLLGYQAGLTFRPKFTWAIWRNSDYKLLFNKDWGVCIA